MGGPGRDEGKSPFVFLRQSAHGSRVQKGRGAGIVVDLIGIAIPFVGGAMGVAQREGWDFAPFRTEELRRRAKDVT